MFFLLLTVLKLINGLPCNEPDPTPSTTCVEGIYSCGPLNELSQGTVVQCINGQNVFIDNCNDFNTNTCVLINDIPYCVNN